MSDAIPYARPVLDDEDIAAVEAVLKGVWLTQGPRVAEFEKAVARVAGTRHAIAVSNGTAALHLAYAALGVGAGNNIVTSPITFAATANAAVLLGAEVRFADIDPQTLTLDPDALEAAITPRTRAIVPVDFAGLPCAMDEINAIAAKHRLPVVVDGAHSFGARYRSRPCGSLATMTTFSFHAVKAAAAGEGGAVATDDPDLAARITRLRSHGITTVETEFELEDFAADRGSDDKDDGGALHDRSMTGPAPWYYEVQELGWNYRMTDIQCALGISQIGKLDRFLARRREIAARYDRAFAQHPLIRKAPRRDDSESALHLYVARLDLENMTASRRQVIEAMRGEGIGAHVHYIPVHLQPFYRRTHGFEPGDFPAAEAYYRQAVTLPLHPAMTDSDVDRVIDVLMRVVK